MSEKKTQDKYFQEWYEKNKEKLSEKRKEKYEKDPDYREKRRLEARRYYWMQKRRAVRVEEYDVDDLDVKPNDVLTIEITDERDIRNGMEIEVPVYFTSGVAKVVGRSSLTVRLWFLKGYVDEALYRNRLDYRMITKDQLNCFAHNVSLLKMPAKEFAKSPFFVQVKKCVRSLNKNGLELMDKDKWRIDLAPCPWCGKTPSLQIWRKKGWVYAQCFECVPPGDSSREEEKWVEVIGTCEVCKNDIDQKKHVIEDRKLVVKCNKCGRKLDRTEFSVLMEDE